MHFKNVTIYAGISSISRYTINDIYSDTLTKEIDVDLLQVVHRAELIELVVYLVEDERLVVVGREVLHNFVHFATKSTKLLQ